MNPPPRNLLCCSWSGGKDSCLALYRTLAQGGQLASLVTMFTEDGQRSRSDGLARECWKPRLQRLEFRCFLRRPRGTIMKQPLSSCFALQEHGAQRLQSLVTPIFRATASGKKAFVVRPAVPRRLHSGSTIAWRRSMRGGLPDLKLAS